MTTQLEAIKEKQQKTWASGNYAVIGNQLVLMGERLVEAVDVRSGQKVLDVATGSGNTAISAARRHAEVTGLDYVPSLIEQAEERARAEGLDVALEVGDAENLPFEGVSFEVVLSTLGARSTKKGRMPLRGPDLAGRAIQSLRERNGGIARGLPGGGRGETLNTPARGEGSVPPPYTTKPVSALEVPNLHAYARKRHYGNL